MSALLCAAKQGHLHVVQWLLEQGGSQLTEKNKEGQTVFELAGTGVFCEPTQKTALEAYLKETFKKNPSRSSCRDSWSTFFSTAKPTTLSRKMPITENYSFVH